MHGVAVKGDDTVVQVARGTPYQAESALAARHACCESSRRPPPPWTSRTCSHRIQPTETPPHNRSRRISNHDDGRGLQMRQRSVLPTPPPPPPPPPSHALTRYSFMPRSRMKASPSFSDDTCTGTCFVRVLRLPLMCSSAGSYTSRSTWLKPLATPPSRYCTPPVARKYDENSVCNAAQPVVTSSLPCKWQRASTTTIGLLAHNPRPKRRTLGRDAVRDSTTRAEPHARRVRGGRIKE